MAQQVDQAERESRGGGAGVRDSDEVVVALGLG